MILSPSSTPFPMPLTTSTTALSSSTLSSLSLSHILPPSFTCLTNPRSSSTTTMTPTVALALSTLACESLIIFTHSLFIFSQRKTSPFSWRAIHLSRRLFWLRHPRSHKKKRPRKTRGHLVDRYDRFHTHTNEIQAHCSLSAWTSSFSSVAAPLFVPTTLRPLPSKMPTPKSNFRVRTGTLFLTKANPCFDVLLLSILFHCPTTHEA